MFHVALIRRPVWAQSCSNSCTTSHVSAATDCFQAGGRAGRLQLEPQSEGELCTLAQPLSRKRRFACSWEIDVGGFHSGARAQQCLCPFWKRLNISGPVKFNSFPVLKSSFIQNVTRLHKMPTDTCSQFETL